MWTIVPPRKIMVHETFLSLMGHLDKLSDAGSRQTWNYVLTALKHHCFNWMKKQDRMVSYCREDDIWAVEEKGLEEECIGQEQERGPRCPDRSAEIPL